MAQTQFKMIPLTGVDAATLGLGFVPINPLGLEEACFQISIINGSNVLIFVSIDDLNSQEIVAVGGRLNIYAQVSSQPNARECLIAKGTVVKVNGNAGAGLVYLSGYYV